MVRHIVLTRFRSEVSEKEIESIYARFDALIHTLESARNFIGGRSQSPEHIERGYMHGFVIDFDDWQGLEVYTNNELHKAIGADLVAAAEGGIDGILVLDIEA